MPIALLTLLKFVLLGLLYLFLLRVVRAMVVDVYGPRHKSPPRPRSAAVRAEPAPRSRARNAPREIVVHPPNGRPQVASLSDGAVTLGRAEHVEVVVDDVYVSDEHAQVFADDDGWSVRDLGSTNGTFLNGEKVTQVTPVGAGDQLRIGKTRVEVRR